MPRPSTKQELISLSNKQFDKLQELISSITDEELNSVFLFEDRDRNVRDVLIHLYEWHKLLLSWIQANIKGKEKTFLPEPYNWKTYPQMNIEFWKKHQNTLYADSLLMLNKSHKQVMLQIDSFSNEELFSKKYFTWTGTTSLGSYCVSATSSHYDWAIKKIKKHIKIYRESL